MNDLKNFSLLYPDASLEAEHYSGKGVPAISMEELSELGLLEFLDPESRDLSEYFTMSPAVMNYRRDMFRDMLDFEELGRMLNSVIPISASFAVLKWIAEMPRII